MTESNKIFIFYEIHLMKYSFINNNFYLYYIYINIYYNLQIYFYIHKKIFFIIIYVYIYCS